MLLSGDITQDEQNEIKNKLRETRDKYNTIVNETVLEKKNTVFEL